MGKPVSYNLKEAHVFFSADCFNRAWEEIEKPTRTLQENERMLMLAMTSLWHWTQREDATPVNYSIGYWQLARVYALLNQAEEARHYGRACLQVLADNDEVPFYRGYGYEALARAEMAAGQKEKAREYRELALREAEKIKDAEERTMLEKDLGSIH